MIKILKDKRFILILIFILAAIFRLYGLNWDENNHLHPDERFLTMVTTSLEFPKSIRGFLDPKLSTFSPYNKGYPFYVYGTFPLIVVKFFSSFIHLNAIPYNNITLVGRTISAFLDLGTLLLVFLTALKIFNKEIAVLATFFYSVSVFPIQQSHFFIVDSFLVFFSTLTILFIIYLLKNFKIIYSALAGVFFGLALASKISALVLLPTIGLSFVFLLVFKKAKASKIFLAILVFLLFGYISFRLTDTKTFSSSNIFNPSLNQLFVNNLKQLKSFEGKDTFYPPAIQWIKTKPLLFPFKNLVFWGLGLPLGLLAILGTLFSIKELFLAFRSFNKLTINQALEIIILSFVLILFLYQGMQFAKTMRYFYPIYPFLSIFAARFFYLLTKKLKSQVVWALSFLLLVIWPISFIQIYTRPHTRILASKWIYENIPPGSTLSCEYWDDCLPLSFVKQDSAIFFKTETLHLFEPDTPEKWEKINRQLEKIDYLILSSNRLWGTIPKVPEKYPITSEFYQKLFAEELQFNKVAEFTSYPTVPILNLSINDLSAEETFTVYDHPKVIIFKKR